MNTADIHGTEGVLEDDGTFPICAVCREVVDDVSSMMEQPTADNHIVPSDRTQIPTTDKNISDHRSEGAHACRVCRIDIEGQRANGQEPRVLECGHSFHKECLEQWLRQNSSCPICRRVVVVDSLAQLETRRIDVRTTARYIMAVIAAVVGTFVIREFA